MASIPSGWTDDRLSARASHVGIQDETDKIGHVPFFPEPRSHPLPYLVRHAMQPCAQRNA